MRAASSWLQEAREIVNHLDPVGVGARDLRECLLIQIKRTAERGCDCAAADGEKTCERCNGWLR